MRFIGLPVGGPVTKRGKVKLSLRLPSACLSYTIYLETFEAILHCTFFFAKSGHVRNRMEELD